MRTDQRGGQGGIREVDQGGIEVGRVTDESRMVMTSLSGERSIRDYYREGGALTFEGE